jgi:uncharacterized membrane protein
MKRIARHANLAILGGILLVALFLRLYQIDAPLAEYQSWRQIASVNLGKEVLSGGFFDRMSMEQPDHYIEFPLINTMYVWLHSLIPAFSLAMWGRLVTAIISLTTIISLYYLCLKEQNRTTAIIAASVFAIFPYFVFFSRTILPEVPAIAAALASITLLLQFRDAKKRLPALLYLLAATVFMAIAVVMKPPILVFLIPAAVPFIQRYTIDVLKHPAPYLFFFGVLASFVLWLLTIGLPAVLPERTSLFGTIQTADGDVQSIFFSPLILKTLFLDRITNAILGGIALVPLVIGSISNHKSPVIHAFGIASLIFILMFQGGNYLHPYYQIIIFPVIALYIGIGVKTILSHRKVFSPQPLVYSVLAVGLTLSLLFSHRIVSDYYTYSSDLIRIAKILSSLTSADDRIVTDQQGDGTLLFLANRTGSASFDGSLEAYREQGYQILVTGSNRFEELNTESDPNAVLFRNDKFVILLL